MKNKRRRTQTKTVLTAVVRVAIGLVLHRPHCALLSGGFAYGNEDTIWYYCINSGDLSFFFYSHKTYRRLPVLQHNVIGVNNIALLCISPTLILRY